MTSNSQINNRVDIAGVKIDPLTINQANTSIANIISNNYARSYYVVKPYVEFVVRANKDEAIKDILNRADLVLADGVSLQWAASYLYGTPKHKFAKMLRSGLVWLQNPRWRSQILPDKMSGANQTIPLLHLAEKHNWRVGIIGSFSKPEALKTNIQTRFKKLNNIFTWSGYFEPSDETKLIDEIKSAKLDILFVAMGFPRQELFISRNLDSKIAKVIIGEGGTFDYDQFGGKFKRAPKWMQNAGIEWLWRLLIQPSRVYRQLAIPKFLILIYSQARKIN